MTDEEAVKVLSNYPVCGVRFNVIRRPLSGGKGNIKPHIARATKSSYTPAETDEEFYERLWRDYIAAEPESYFFRIRADITSQDIQVFRDMCLDPLLENLCDWYDEVVGKKHWSDRSKYWSYRTPLNYRHPFGIYNALEESGSTEYDAYLATGSESGLRRVEELFTELK